MSTLSSDRGLTLPTVSSDGNVWGTELNTTINALDTILGGSLTLQSSAGLSVTLTSSEAQMSRIVVQGAINSSSPFTLTFGSSNFALGNYQIWNNSSAGGGGVLCQTTGAGATCTVNSGTMRTVNVDGTNAQFADAQPTTGVPAYVNKFRNPGMDIFQRTNFTVIPTTPAYGIDGWLVGVATGAPSLSQTYNTFLSGSAARFTGNNAACTNLTMQQNIESVIAAQLLGAAPSTTQPITVRFDIYNNSGASFIPALSTNYANAQDNFGGVTNDLAPVNLQTCPNGTLTTVAYTFTPSANLANGYQVILNLNVALNNLGGTVDVSHADIRVTPGVAAGLNGAPPTPELRPIHEELLYCQRYFFQPFSGWWYLQSTAAAAGQTVATTAQFPTPMRVKPTLTGATFTHSNCPNPTQPTNGASQTGWAFQINPSGAGGANAFITSGQFSAEL